MESVNEIDVIEQDIVDYSSLLLDILLADRTSGKNILWASDDYTHMGAAFAANEQITPDLITGGNTRLIQPRTAKAQQHQANRTRSKAEVFTPSWVCNVQNNLVDESWFGRKDVFNISKGRTWKATKTPVQFPNDKKRTWKKYVDANRIEIACGEAPYLASRYDAVSGEVISTPNRIGLLDRKLRIVSENTENEADWLKWTERAFQSVYGFEFQGDNLLLARENLLYTFVDYVRFHLHREPSMQEMRRIATIISWNLWQMDGTSFTVPYGKIKEDINQTILPAFIDRPKDENFTDPCRIKDWRSKLIIEYRSLIKEER